MKSMKVIEDTTNNKGNNIHFGDNMGNNSSVKRSILTKLIGYQESMVLIICTNK